MLPLPPIARLLRPHQYAKNLLVFSAPGAAGRLDEGRVVALSVAAFLLFCAVSSAGYVLNDLLDVDADRRHPTKRERPIASGAVTPDRAKALLGFLLIGSIAGSALIGFRFLFALVAYAVVSFTYSLRLKHVPWLELFAISAGFLLRAVAGGAATDTSISGWFLLVVSTGALLVITGKRLGELSTLGPSSGSRHVLAGYSMSRLRQLAALSATFAVAGYASWAASEAGDRAANSSGSVFLRLTTLPFAIAIGRYLMLAWRGAGETPESLFVRDRLVLGAGAAWVVLYAIGIYA